MQQTSPVIVKKILLAQFVTVFILGTAVSALFGIPAGLSASIGGLICWFPNAIAARLMFARRDADPQRLLAVIYRAELGKFIVTALLFALVFIVYSGIEPLGLFGAYVVTYGVQWAAPMVYKRNKKFSDNK